MRTRRSSRLAEKHARTRIADDQYCGGFAAADMKGEKSSGGEQQFTNKRHTSSLHHADDGRFINEEQISAENQLGEHTDKEQTSMEVHDDDEECAHKEMTLALDDDDKAETSASHDDDDKGETSASHDDDKRETLASHNDDDKGETLASHDDDECAHRKMTLALDDDDDNNKGETSASDHDDDEAPESISFSGGRQMSQQVRRQQAEGWINREKQRKERTTARQKRYRELKLTNQRQVEVELLMELQMEEQQELSQLQQQTVSRQNGSKKQRRAAGRSGGQVAEKHSFLDNYITVDTGGGGGTRFQSAVVFDDDISAPLAVNGIKLSSLKNTLLNSRRHTKRVSSVQLARIKHKQIVSGKY